MYMSSIKIIWKNISNTILYIKLYINRKEKKYIKNIILNHIINNILICFCRLQNINFIKIIYYIKYDKCDI